MIDQIKITHRFTVWIGGVEATAYYLTRKEAETIADEARAAGYDDVQIDEITQLEGK
jgi:predicted aminopeptidase